MTAVRMRIMRSSTAWRCSTTASPNAVLPLKYQSFRLARRGSRVVVVPGSFDAGSSAITFGEVGANATNRSKELVDVTSSVRIAAQYPCILLREVRKPDGIAVCRRSPYWVAFERLGNRRFPLGEPRGIGILGHDAKLRSSRHPLPSFQRMPGHKHAASRRPRRVVAAACSKRQ